ncbi:MAG: hypothetical protein BAJALOKI2v1_70040 [Promethearchaeota archaeon]|nr:MAG: hypothetical protein BAJALOKI2v1_70040 [Candidatus Lokiarchaeota archaeon]
MISETIQKTEQLRSNIRVKAVHKISKIRYALQKFLYVPDHFLKPKIISKILKYLTPRLAKREDQSSLKVFIAYDGRYLKGFIIVENNPHYTSRNRNSATFGWLFAKKYEVCAALLEECERFSREQGLKLLRGPINFPKSVGGYGLQGEGFEEQMLYGVAFSHPIFSSKLSKYLTDYGFKEDAEYLTMEVTHDKWKKGTHLDEDIEIRYLTFEEFKNRKNEIIEMFSGAFYSVLPDAFGAQRYKEVMELLKQIPPKYYRLPKDLDYEKYSTQPEFLNAWRDSEGKDDLITFFHLAFDKKTDKIVGIITCLPDLYEIWKGENITRVNVDVAVVRKGYGRKGIFSSLNNIGQLTGNILGVRYYEGTSIWNLNEDAVKTILPHGRINRRFYVYQKRVKKS